jgi:hypothetical protein
MQNRMFFLVNNYSGRIESTSKSFFRLLGMKEKINARHAGNLLGLEIYLVQHERCKRSWGLKQVKANGFECVKDSSTGPGYRLLTPED